MFTDVQITAAARAAHEANRAYCIAIGDNSQQSWGETSQDNRDASVALVRRTVDGLTPEQEHEGWCKVKREQGWQYGPARDNEKKLHPCLVPYAELPPAQRAKDALLGGVVRTMLAAFNQ